MAYDKVVDSAMLDGYFGDIADAIRTKGGSGTYTPGDMPQAITDLPAGDPDLMDFLSGCASGDIDITLPEYSYAFTAYFYKDGYAIPHGNRNVTGLTLRGCRILGNTNDSQKNGLLIAGTGTIDLKSIELPDCEELSAYKPNSYSTVLSNLERLSAPKLTSFNNGYLFYGCSALTDVQLDALTRTVTNLFKRCTALSEIRLPSCYNIDDSSFDSCSSLVTFDMGSSVTRGGRLGYQSFYDDAVLDALVLRNNTACTLGYANTLQGTAIANGTGYIYVPRDMISTYEAATNWSTFAGRFRAIEDYTDDGMIDGEFVHP